MANGWTPERRARQAVLIQNWKPWTKATGPRSTEGKARVSRNAYTGGQRPAMRQFSKVLNETFREQRLLVQGMT